MDVLQRASPLDVSCLQQGAACISLVPTRIISLFKVFIILYPPIALKGCQHLPLYELSAARGLAFVVSISPFYFKDELLMCIFIKVDH